MNWANEILIFVGMVVAMVIGLFIVIVAYFARQEKSRVIYNQLGCRVRVSTKKRDCRHFKDQEGNALLANSVVIRYPEEGIVMGSSDGKLYIQFKRGGAHAMGPEKTRKKIKLLYHPKL